MEVSLTDSFCHHHNKATGDSPLEFLLPKSVPLLFTFLL